MNYNDTIDEIIKLIDECTGIDCGADHDDCTCQEDLRALIKHVLQARK